jgi:hypothetical protein
MIRAIRTRHERCRIVVNLASGSFSSFASSFPRKPPKAPACHSSAGYARTARIVPAFPPHPARTNNDMTGSVLVP